MGSEVFHGGINIWDTRVSYGQHACQQQHAFQTNKRINRQTDEQTDRRTLPLRKNKGKGKGTWIYIAP